MTKTKFSSFSRFSGPDIDLVDGLLDDLRFLDTDGDCGEHILPGSELVDGGPSLLGPLVQLVVVSVHVGNALLESIKVNLGGLDLVNEDAFVIGLGLAGHLEAASLT